MLLSNILTSVYKSTSWRLLRPRAFSGREWLPSGKGKCKTCKNEIGDWLGWRVRTRGGGEEIEFFIVFDIGHNKMDNYCTDRLMIIALWWWYCQTHNIYSGFGRQNSSCGEYFILRFKDRRKKTEMGMVDFSFSSQKVWNLDVSISSWIMRFVCKISLSLLETGENIYGFLFSSRK